MTDPHVHPFLQGVMAMADQAVDRDTADLWSLGQLILALEAYAGSRYCCLDTGGMMNKPHSYRGYYRMLAFEPTRDHRTVDELLDELRACVGKTFTGYKGGDFTMDQHTKVWVSWYGTSSGVGIVGVDGEKGSNGIAIIQTKRIET